MSDLSSRRDFVKAAGAAAVAASVLPLDALGLAQPRRRRYAIVGTGDRGSSMWGRALVQRYSDVLEFVGLSDVNHKRVAAAREIIGVQCPTFTSFDEMCASAKPDVLMVTTVDAYHADYVVKGLDRGMDVMTEKPMVIDEAQCAAVLDAEKRNNRKIVVTFNYRYAPKHQKIKEVLLAGDIGRIISADFSWYLDVQHGADYFRRWHRLRSKGGTLLVHKASHHFDLMNWWMDADPVEVSGAGALRVYGKNGPFRFTHCRPCPHKAQCPFYYDITKNANRMKLYVGPEDVDGYHRDGCVFREDVDIYDTMSAIVKYANGATMTYSLNAAMPFEGYRLAFNGEKGRLEIRDFERQPWTVENETEIHLTRNFGKRVSIAVPKPIGGHGGGDDRLRDLIFRNADAPEYMRLPDSHAGAMACLTGIGVRRSIERSEPVKIADLIRL